MKKLIKKDQNNMNKLSLVGRVGVNSHPPPPSPGQWEWRVGEGRVGVDSHPPPSFSRSTQFFLVKKKRDTQKKYKSQRLAAVTILVVQLVMLNSLIRFLSSILFRTF